MDSEQIDGWDQESERAWKNDTHEVEFPEVVIELLKQVLPVKTKVLDAGCGIGKHVKAFSKIGYVVTGVEQSSVGVKYAREINPTATILHMRIQEITFKEEFDLIHTSAVLQHNLHERKIMLLQKFHTALKQYGYYLCTENTFTEKNIGAHFRREGNQFIRLTELSEDITDGYSFTEKGWTKFMAQNGFKHIKTIWPWPYYLFKKSEVNRHGI